MNKSKHLSTGVSAGLLSAVIPGAGHSYIGRPRRFLLAFAVWVTIVVSLASLDLLSTLWGFATLLATELVIYLFGIVDSSILGSRFGPSEGNKLKRFGATILWAFGIAAMMIAWAAIREPLLGYAVYRVPSPTMKPTLEVGDTILVSTRQGRGSALSAGAIVVVRNAANNQLYVRRLQERIGPSRFALSHDWAWAPHGAEPETVAQQDILGMVTAVLWSPERQKAGFVPK